MVDDSKGFCATVEGSFGPKRCETQRKNSHQEKVLTHETQGVIEDENDKAISFYEKGEVADSRSDLVEANKNIASDRSPNSLTITYEAKSRKDTAAAFRKAYDFLAQHWGYKSADHMIAVAHTEILAKAIADPLKFGPSALKAIPQIQEKIHPQEKVTAKERIPGGGKSEIIKRIEGHYQNSPKPD